MKKLANKKAKRMKQFGFVLIGAITLLSFGKAHAGNPDRAGQAGGGQLLINPWARTSGWAGANSASVQGLESQFLNVAGLAHTKKTELIFARTNWMAGSGININSFGFSQKAGSSGVLGVGIVSTGFGSIDITTVESPDGGNGFFTPQFLNLSLGYAKEFSNSIFGGINVKVLNESIADLKATGVCFDAGIQYITTIGEANKKMERKNLKFGISLKNVGPQMSYSGDGISVKANLISTGAALTLEQRSNRFDLPSLITIGGAYDYYFSKENNDHRITTAGTFVSNSFTSDQFNIGLEYAFRSMFMFRGGFAYEKNILSSTERATALTGPTAGLSVELPFAKREKENVKTNSTFALDYSYRATNPFGGCHTLGLRIAL